MTIGYKVSEESILKYVGSIFPSDVKVDKLEGKIVNFLWDFAKGSDSVRKMVYGTEIKVKNTHRYVLFCMVVKKNKKDINKLDIAYKINYFNIRYNCDKFTKDEERTIQECITKSLASCEKELLCNENMSL